jgi:hypothetical protein
VPVTDWTICCNGLSQGMPVPPATAGPASSRPQVIVAARQPRISIRRMNIVLVWGAVFSAIDSTMENISTSCQLSVVDFRAIVAFELRTSCRRHPGELSTTCGFCWRNLDMEASTPAGEAAQVSVDRPGNDARDGVALGAAASITAVSA